jgi:hypothetical protein
MGGVIEQRRAWRKAYALSERSSSTALACADARKHPAIEGSSWTSLVRTSTSSPDMIKEAHPLLARAEDLTEHVT